MDDGETSIRAGGKLLITRREARVHSSQGGLSEPRPHELNSVVRSQRMDQKCQQCISHLGSFYMQLLPLHVLHRHIIKPFSLPHI